MRNSIPPQPMMIVMKDPMTPRKIMALWKFSDINNARIFMMDAVFKGLTAYQINEIYINEKSDKSD